jgi:hypothetical protein
MKDIKDEIIRFIEPVYHFCLKRLSNRCDAEDLANEIMVHILDVQTNIKLIRLKHGFGVLHITDMPDLSKQKSNITSFRRMINY